MKVNFFDRRIYAIAAKPVALLSSALSVALLFLDIADKNKIKSGLIFLSVIVVIYLIAWMWANKMTRIKIQIDGSNVHIKTGDLFKQPDIKVISFNEYFDTIVDDRIIAKATLNGQFIEKFHKDKVSELDAKILADLNRQEIVGKSVTRIAGKNFQYPVGTICAISDDYLITAFAKFEGNKAVLSMPEYLEFLITFWDNINKMYSLKSVSVPVFGSGILRIKENKNISDEELLKIMLWTFRISEMKFKFPAELTIVIHEGKIEKINLLDVASSKNGL